MALIQAVRRRYDIPQRWYKAQGRATGAQALADYDRSAPILPEEVTFSYAEARDLVLDTYSSFSEDAGALAQQFFTDHWIDAPPRPHKRGARSAPTRCPACTPTCCSNFTAKRRDVLTMAMSWGTGCTRRWPSPGHLPPVDAADPG